MVWLLILSAALADCELPPSDITYVWPEEDQEVGTDVWVTLTGGVPQTPDATLYAADGDITVPLTAVRRVNCSTRPYDCAAQLQPAEPLEPGKTWQVQVDGESIRTFRTGPGEHVSDVREPLELSRGAITDETLAPDYRTYTASWSASSKFPGEWMEYDYRGDDIDPGSASTYSRTVVLGYSTCDGGADIGTLSTAEVRARRVSVTGEVGAWTAWTDVDPALTRVDHGDDSASCSSLPRSLTWLGLPLLFLSRRRGGRRAVRHGRHSADSSGLRLRIAPSAPIDRSSSATLHGGTPCSGC